MSDKQDEKVAETKSESSPSADAKASADAVKEPAEESAEAAKADAKAEGDVGAKAAAEGGAGDEEDDEDTDASDTVADAASPEAIAKRVDALGGAEDEADRIARAEEKKLLERKAKAKKGKKGGLEKAASKKLSDIGKRAEPKRVVATAVDVADPLMVRTQKLGEWAKQNQKTVSLVGLAIVALLLGAAGITYMDHQKELDASVALARGVSDERGHVVEKEQKEDEERRDPRPVFKSADERREAALKSYREVEAKFPKTGAAILARLSEGSILLDKKDADGAASAFNEVKASPLAAADVEVRGRALEGLGFAYELKASAVPAEANKNLDEAIKVYKELENSVDVKGFKELAMYHQARCLQGKGEKDEAKKLLVTVRERVSKPGENHPFPYLEEVATERLRQLDPTAVPAKQAGNMGGAAGPQMNEAQLKALIERLKKQQQEHGGDDHGGGGGAPHQ